MSGLKTKRLYRFTAGKKKKKGPGLDRAGINVQVLTAGLFCLKPLLSSLVSALFPAR